MLAHIEFSHGGGAVAAVAVGVVAAAMQTLLGPTMIMMMAMSLTVLDPEGRLLKTV